MAFSSLGPKGPIALVLATSLGIVPACSSHPGASSSASGGDPGAASGASGQNGTGAASGASGQNGTGAASGVSGSSGSAGMSGSAGAGVAGAGAASSAGASGSSGASGSGSSGSAGVSGASGLAGSGGSACTPSCANKTCGSDGCNGTCGGCQPSQMCGADGTCKTQSGAGITVDASSQLTPISPDIYGVAFATDATDDSYKVSTLDRWGGDSEETYNWQKDLNNSGGDWNCANYSTGNGNSAGADAFVQTNKSNGLDTLMTIPINGWVANVATPGDDTYSAQLGQNLSFCNYPQLSDGSLVPSGTCCKAIGTQESVVIDKGSKNLDTSFMSDWVSHLVSRFGPAGSGGVKYYQLDNEPDNWQGLRADIYPALYPPGTNCMDYSVKIASGDEAGVSPNDDIMNRSVAYAAAIKNVDPAAQVLFLSVMNPDDMIDLLRTECGVGTWGGGTVPYTIDNSYAMAMMSKGKQYEDTNHRRIFDCLDTHYPGTAQEMWTNTFSRFQGWINSTYPGTGICISEYNVANDTSDASVTAKQADYLGTFGVKGVRVASYWTTLAPKDSSGKHVHNYSYNAFAMFRNYDGAGGKFGSVSVGAASSYSSVHAYAASDSTTNSPTTLWVMLVNTGASTQSNMTVTISNFSAGASAKVYQSVNGAAPAAAPDVAVSGGAISGLSLAANSLMLLVIGH